MLKEKRKKLKLFLDLYMYTVEICITNNIILSRKKDDKRVEHIYRGNYAPGGLQAYSHNKRISIIYLNKNSKTDVVAHESWHCIRTIADWIGAEYENEFIAYHLGYLVYEITKLI